MSNVARAGLCAFFLLISARASLANDCDAVLAYNTLRDNSKSNIALATLDLVTDNNFQEFKKNFQGGVKFPIDGIPIEATTSYSEFDQARREYKKEHKFDYSFSEVKDLSAIYLAPGAVDAWVTCIEQGQSNFLDIIPVRVTEKDIILNARWKPGPSLDAGEPGEPIILGGSLKGELPVKFYGGWTPLHFSRDPGESFSFDLPIKGGSAKHVELPAYSPIYDKPLNCLAASTKGCFACAIPSEELLGAISGLAQGNITQFKCTDMIPSSDAVANIKLLFKVVGADSGRTRVGWFVKSGTASAEDHQGNENVDHRLTGPQVDTRSIIVDGIKTSGNGNVFLQLGVTDCYWTNLNGDHNGSGCAIAAQPGSSLRLDVK
jgi:hypothetical protein